MNKKHWITISLDGQLPETLLYQLADESYHLVVSKLTKRDKAVLESI
jgi:predicted DNA-binding protein (MmcQ/YjbR family)